MSALSQSDEAALAAFIERQNAAPLRLSLAVPTLRWSQVLADEAGVGPVETIQLRNLAEALDGLGAVCALLRTDSEHVEDVRVSEGAVEYEPLKPGVVDSLWTAQRALHRTAREVLENLVDGMSRTARERSHGNG